MSTQQNFLAQAGTCVFRCNELRKHRFIGGPVAVCKDCVKKRFGFAFNAPLDPDELADRVWVTVQEAVFDPREQQSAFALVMAVIGSEPRSLPRTSVRGEITSKHLCPPAHLLH